MGFATVTVGGCCCASESWELETRETSASPASPQCFNAAWPERRMAANAMETGLPMAPSRWVTGLSLGKLLTHHWRFLHCRISEQTRQSLKVRYHGHPVQFHRRW